MSEICPVCGLPKELCICKELEKETEKITITKEKRKFGKIITIIKGINDEKTAKELTKELKRKLACGGTYKEGIIELQGNHVEKVKKHLLTKGYSESQITIK